MAELFFHVLGPLEVRRDGEDRTPRGPRQRALMGIFLVNAGTVLSVDRLIDLLWGEQPPATSRSALQVHVTKLRRLIGPAIVTREPGYALEVPGEAIDARRFERLANEGRTALREEAVHTATAVLEEALDLWRGPAYEDVRYEAFAEQEAARLEGLRLRVLTDRIEADLALGRHQTLIGELDALVAEHPFHEPLWGSLMLALARSGQGAGALRAYQRLGRLFEAELGTEPGEELRALAERIRAGDPTLAVRSAHPPGNLPHAGSSFVGRDEALRKVPKLIAEHPLVTLTGPAGAGKTRLALEVSHRVTDDAPGGVWWVELASLPEDAGVLQAIAGVFDLPESRRHLLRALIEHLRSRRLLLVLDNCEHLLDSLVPLVEEILSSCPSVRIMTTSRERLGVPGETIWAVGPLRLSSEESDDPFESEAVRLFFDRVWALVPGLASSPEATDAACRITESLDGLPLAIELAAAWTEVLGLEEVNRRLEQGLPLPRPPHRSGSGRHLSLQQAVEWSYRLLDPDEQRLFRHLGVFRGGWTLETAETLEHGDAGVLDSLSALVRKSMVVRQPASDRYDMLEVIRAYAWDRLEEAGELDAVRDRHLDLMLSLVGDSVGPALEAAGRLPRLQEGRANLRAALEWARDGDRSDRGLRLAGRLWWFWFRLGPPPEGLTWLEQFLDADPDGQATDRLTALHGMGYLATVLGHTERAQRAAEEALVLARESEDLAGVADALEILGVCEAVRGDIDSSVPLLEERLTLVRRLEDPWRTAATLSLMLHVQNQLDGAPEAHRMAAEARRLFEEIGDPWGLSWCDWNEGHLERLAGRHEAARGLFLRCLGRCRTTGNDLGMRLALDGLGVTEAERGRYHDAARVLTLTERIHDTVGYRLYPGDQGRLDQAWSAIRSELDDQGLTDIRSELESTSVERAVSQILTESAPSL